MATKVVAITGSPRKDLSRTTQLLKSVLVGAAAAGAETELLDATTVKVEFCTACNRCHALGSCYHEDDFAAIYDKLLAADGIVLGSPCYLWHVTAQLKTLLDRLSEAIHCQRLLDKYGAAVCTAGSTGHEDTATAMEKMLQAMGVQTVGQVACAPPPGPLDPEGPCVEKALALGRDLVAAIREGRQYPDQLAEIAQRRAHFAQIITANRDNWQWEYDFFQKQGWV